ncbi:MAG: glycoside hydrolase, partial [candidate division WOR-3 bacterium]|nr:glycoside hydrolase [candidate division WOR-3 bacterium]
LDSLKNKFYLTPALPPTMKWIDSIPPNKIRELSIQKDTNRVILEWKEPEKNSQAETAYGYVVYRFVNENIDLNNPERIVQILMPRRERFIDRIDKNIVGEITYVVTALDRHRNESEGEIVRIVIK